MLVVSLFCQYLMFGVQVRNHSSTKISSDNTNIVRHNLGSSKRGITLGDIFFLFFFLLFLPPQIQREIYLVSFPCLFFSLLRQCISFRKLKCCTPYVFSSMVLHSSLMRCKRVAALQVTSGLMRHGIFQNLQTLLSLVRRCSLEGTTSKRSLP